MFLCLLAISTEPVRHNVGKYVTPTWDVLQLVRKGQDIQHATNHFQNFVASQVWFKSCSMKCEKKVSMVGEQAFLITAAKHTFQKSKCFDYCKRFLLVSCPELFHIRKFATQKRKWLLFLMCRSFTELFVVTLRKRSCPNLMTCLRIDT